MQMGKSSAHGGHPVPMWGSPLPHKSTHVVFCLDDGSVLYLTDIRQFARLHLLPDAEVERFLKRQKIGVEPLTRRFTARQLQAKLSAEAFRSRRRSWTSRSSAASATSTPTSRCGARSCTRGAGATR